MPQLNPAPWFLILLMTWTILILLMNKTLHSKHPNQPTHKTLEIKLTHPWPWPWS